MDNRKSSFSTRRPRRQHPASATATTTRRATGVSARRRTGVLRARRQRSRETTTRGRRSLLLGNRKPAPIQGRRRHGSLRVHARVKLRDGLQLYLEVGSAWFGLILSFAVLIWFPDALPLIAPLLRLI